MKYMSHGAAKLLATIPVELSAMLVTKSAVDFSVCVAVVFRLTVSRSRLPV